MLRWCLTILLASIVLAAPAQALPPDPLPVPLTPADGAAVGVDPGGIAVTFSCPVYRVFSAGEGFDVFRRPEGLRALDVVVAHGRGQRPACRPRRARQRRDFRRAGSLRLRPRRGRLTAAAGDTGDVLLAGLAALHRVSGSYEAGPVRRLVLRATATLALKPPAKVYAGFPFVLPVAASGVPTSRRCASSAPARRSAPPRSRASAQEPVVTLAAGTSKLRAAVADRGRDRHESGGHRQGAQGLELADQGERRRQLQEAPARPS